MKTFLEKLDVKLITAGGGILLAGLLAYILFKILTNDLAHVSQSIDRQADIQQETNKVLRSISENATGTTEVLRIKERRLK